MKVPSVFTSSFSLFLSFFSLEGSSMTRTKNKNDYVSNSYMTLCFLCKLLKFCWLFTFIYRSKDMFDQDTKHNDDAAIPVPFLWTLNNRFHWYRPILSNKGKSRSVRGYTHLRESIYEFNKGYKVELLLNANYLLDIIAFNHCNLNKYLWNEK